MTGTAPLEALRLDHTGSTFLHALAALGDSPGTDGSRGGADAFPQRLASWFDWTDAVRLSGVLGCAADPGASVGFIDPCRLAADAQEYARVRRVLMARVAVATAETGGADRPAVIFDRWPAPSAPPRSHSTDADFATHRQRHAACQQAMDSQVGALRRRLRATLAAGPPRWARLAEIDAVMEQVIGPRERALLAGVAGRLETHFGQLRQGHTLAEDAAALPWLAPFRRTMQTLLLAELELRLQPAWALVAACRSGAAPSDG